MWVGGLGALARAVAESQKITTLTLNLTLTLHPYSTLTPTPTLTPNLSSRT